MRGHVRFLGWLHIVLGALELLAALFIFGIVGGVGWLTGDPLTGGVMTLIATVIGFAVALTALPNVIAGAGLLAFAGWARWLAIIIGVFNLVKFPWGTALGIYTFVILFDDETELLFR